MEKNRMSIMALILLIVFIAISLMPFVFTYERWEKDPLTRTGYVHDSKSDHGINIFAFSELWGLILVILVFVFVGISIANSAKKTKVQNERKGFSDFAPLIALIIFVVIGFFNGFNKNMSLYEDFYELYSPGIGFIICCAILGIVSVLNIKSHSAKREIA